MTPRRTDPPDRHGLQDAAGRRAMTYSRAGTTGPFLPDRLDMHKVFTYKNAMLASEVRKGSAEVLILGTLEERPRHGYEIARLIEARSNGAITFNSATLYPTLRRLEHRGLITGRWVDKAGQRRRRYYRITPAGIIVLRDQRTSWRRFVEALGRVAGILET